MSTTTPDQGITRPVGGDLADVVAAMLNELTQLESRLALRYTTFADRAARHPVAVEGELADLATENRRDAYDGANWVSATARGYYARKRRTTNAAAINASTVLVADATLTVALGEANGTYAFGGRIWYDGSTAGDFKLAFTWPAATTLSKWGFLVGNATTATSVDRLVSTASGTALAAAGLGVGTNTFVDFEGVITLGATTGNLQAQYAQNTSDATNLTIQAGSNLWVMREV